jgi:hypothetical protein
LTGALIIYTTLLKRLSYTVNCIVIDERHANIDGAEAVRMKDVLFKTASALRVQLASIIIVLCIVCLRPGG